MSLLDKTSLCITPNAYKTSKLYSVVPNTTLGDMDVVRGTTATRVNSAGLIESVGVNIPRIDYTNVSCPSILVEPLRTNLFLRSEEFENASWAKLNSSVTANNAISPSGILNADKAILNIGVNPLATDSTGLSQNQTITSGVYTYSIFAKAGERNIIRWRDAGFSGNYLVVNLTNGTFTNGQPTRFVNPQVISYNNGWYRISFTTGTITNPNAYPLRFGDVGQTGDGVSGGFVWGAQLELGSYPTSYIPTIATVTRNADVISKTGISSLIGQTEGTIYTEIKVNKLIGIASRYIFHISDGTINNRIYMAFSGASSNVLRGRIFNGGTLQCSIDTSTITTTGTYKLALAYKNNDIVFYVNGVQIGVDTSATIPTCSRVDIGQNYAGASQLSDNVLLSTLFKTRLTNGELATLTTL